MQHRAQQYALYLAPFHTGDGFLLIFANSAEVILLVAPCGSAKIDRIHLNSPRKKSGDYWERPNFSCIFGPG